jgi:cathepsin B
LISYLDCFHYLYFCSSDNFLQAYPVFGQYVDDDGNRISGDIEFEFALAAINVVRAQCNDTNNFPPLTADNVTIYDDECTRQTIAGQQVITLSFDVPAARDSAYDVDTIYVMISNTAPIDDVNSSALGNNATTPVKDVGITVSAEKDPTGTANDFRLLGIRTLDPETGDGNSQWTCSFTKDDGTYVGSSVGSADANVTDDFDLRRRRSVPQSISATDIDPLESLPIYGRRFLPYREPHSLRSERRDIIADTLSPEARKSILDTLPEYYDARLMLWATGQPPLASVPLNQGACGSCYAFGAATAMAYRLYNHSGGKYNVVPSPQMAMTCSNGCEGGDADVVHDAMVTSYIPASTTQTYTGKVDPADKAAFCAAPGLGSAALAGVQGSIPYVNRRNGVDRPDAGPTSASTSVLGEEAMMQEIYRRGPASVYVQVESLFSTYPANADTCNGVLTDRKCVTGKGSVVADGKCTGRDANHAVTLVGWGVDKVGCPEKGIEPPLRYWIIQNSHGEGWGDCDGVGCGFMKLERGRNTLAVEAAGAVVGFPHLTDARMCPNSTDPSAWCRNGGSFTANCTCYCPPAFGFAGPTCDVCNATCAGGAAPIRTEADPLRGRPATCSCPCSSGYWKPTNLAGYADCGIAVGVWLDGAAAQPLLGNLNTTLSDVVYAPQAPATLSLRFVKIAGRNADAQAPHYGDMVVAVRTGSRPWTKETKWDAIKGKADVCGPKKVENHRVVDCPVDDAWKADGSLEQKTGSLRVAEEGGYDLYLVKYMGQSEFGVDKGFGMDFAKLPQQLWVGGGVSNSSGRRAGPTPGQLKAAMSRSATVNKQNQTAKVISAAASHPLVALCTGSESGKDSDSFRSSSGGT